MKILTILQNAYSHRPLRCPIPYARWFYLFCQCRSGKRLSMIYGGLSEMTALHDAGALIFANTTPTWGVGSDSCLQADAEYLQGEIDKHEPTLLIACGRVAENAVKPIWNGDLFCIPHPASRTVTNALFQACALNIKLLDSPARKAFRQNKGFHEIESI